MNNPELPGSIGANQDNKSNFPLDPLEMMRKSQYYGEGLLGHENELRLLNNPEKVSHALEVLSAVSIGLPVTERVLTKYRFVERQDGEVDLKKENIELLSFVEAKQLFLSPDWLADRRQVGYQAKAVVEAVTKGSARENLKTKLLENSVLTKEDFEDKLGKMGLDNDTRDALRRAYAAGEIVGEPEDKSIKKVLDVVKKEAPRCNARGILFQAFSEYAQRGGDEASLAELFVTSGRADPQGVEFKEIFSNDENKRDSALRAIRSAGLPYQILEEEGKTEWAIEGIHYNMRGGRMVPIIPSEFVNPYQKGWSDKSFKQWLLKMEDVTGGDLFAVYEAYYIAIATGVIAEVSTNYIGDGVGEVRKGQKIGDPPLVASLDQWLMHFWSKQSAEAGVDIDNKKRTRITPYKNKTGFLGSLEKYPKEWLSSFFKSATFKGGDYEGKNVFDLWWYGDASHPDGIPMGEIDWSATDISQPIEEDVRLGTLGAWQYDKFQLWRAVEVMQGNKIELKTITGYTFWSGIARTFDKGFKMSWMPDTRDLASEFPNNRTISVKNPDGTMGSFRKVIKDEDDPRYALLQGIALRYYPVGAVKEGIVADSSKSRSERFSTLSEINMVTDPILKTRLLQDPGSVLIEDFIYAYAESGMLTYPEIHSALCEVYKNDVVRDIFKKSPLLLMKAKEFGLKI